MFRSHTTASLVVPPSAFPRTDTDGVPARQGPLRVHMSQNVECVLSLMCSESDPRERIEPPQATHAKIIRARLPLWERLQARVRYNTAQHSSTSAIKRFNGNAACTSDEQSSRSLLVLHLLTALFHSA